MQPFDLPQAQLAVQHARLAAWQLDQGLRLFRERGNPRASILGILVELNYLERDLALRLRQAEAPSYDPSRSALAHSQAPHPHSVTGSRAPEVKGSRAPGLAPPPIAPPPKTSHDDAPTMPLDGSGYQARGLRSSDSTAPSRAASLTGRERFGRYELRGTVAKGGMGTVYRAFLPELDKIVAIKTLSNDRDPVDRQRFLQEARAAAKLRHPNIVSVHDIGVEQGIDYFTMDLIEGDSLDEIVHKRGRFTPTEAAQLCVKLARALDYAHDLGVVHRDIKPGNVIVEQRTGEPFLTDFGLARQIESSTQLTKTGFAVGTPNYMAPEQATGQKDVDRRADVYGIGTLLYAIIVGEPPFDGPNALATMTSVINDPAPSLKAHERSTPLALDAVCQRAMAKEREDRFATAGELADAIEAALKTPDPPPRSSSPLIVAVLGVLILAMGAAALGLVLARWRRAQAFSDAAAAAGELADAGELAAARERLEEARGLSPDDPEVGRLDDRLTRLERRRDEALAAEAAARARAEAQQRAEELLAEARAEAARGEFRSALRRLNEVSEAAPQRAEVLACGLWCRIGLNQIEAAERDWLAQTPELQAALGAPGAALAVILGNPELALERLSADGSPNSEPRAAAIRALIALQQGRPSLAEESLGEAGPAEEWAQVARTRLVLARGAYDKLAGLLESAPAPPTPYLRAALDVAAMIAERQGRSPAPAATADELDRLRRAIAEAHSDIDLLGVCGALALIFEDRSLTDVAITRIEEVRPQGFRGSVLRGQVAYQEGVSGLRDRRANAMESFVKARRLFEQAIERGDPYVNSRRYIVQTYLLERDLEKAEQWCARGLELEPDSESLLLQQFQILRTQQKNSLAAESARRLLSVAPETPNVREELVSCLIELKRSEEAVREAQDLVSRSPESPKAHHILACAYDARGLTSEAAAALERALRGTSRDVQGVCQSLDYILSLNGDAAATARYRRQLPSVLERLAAAPVTQESGAHLEVAARRLEVAGLIEPARELAARLSVAFPTWAPGLVTHARLCFALGEDGACDTLLAKALGSANLPPGQQVYIVYLLGLSAFARGDGQQCQRQLASLTQSAQPTLGRPGAFVALTLGALSEGRGGQPGAPWRARLKETFAAEATQRGVWARLARVIAEDEELPEDVEVLARGQAPATRGIIELVYGLLRAPAGGRAQLESARDNEALEVGLRALARRLAAEP